MNIIVVTSYYPPDLGAASFRISQMNIGLNRLKNNIHVICPLPNYPFGKILNAYRYKLFSTEVVDNLILNRFWIYPTQSKKPLPRLLSMLSFAGSLWLFIFNLRKILNSDCIIIQNSPLLVSLSAILFFKKIFRKKIILNVSDLWPQSAVDLKVIDKGFVLNQLLKIEKFIYNNSDKFICQSEVISQHISEFCKKPSFLYRNIQPNSTHLINAKKERGTKLKIVYAGLLGVAQGLSELLQHLSLDKDLQNKIEIHVYGGGIEDKLIRKIANLNFKFIKYHGLISKNLLNEELKNFNFALVPLKNDIKGAFPSKIYEMVSMGIPIIYLGSGEAEKFIKENNIGFAVRSGEYDTLVDLLKNIIEMDQVNYTSLVNNCVRITENNLNFQKQIKELNKFIHA